ncbi:hypothetical protein J437_LFUL006599 [Ladona fulva]|uniref:Uncharacterized protein n=1 Tax=Ladona fulva TaxID=123851 RepID=A0A8K0KGU1_LADFU|nr:hypothetical protein J437_LFUL006599 [Ladona fulva]
MKSKVVGFQATSKFLATVRLEKNLSTSKGSRLGNSGNRLELQVLTQLTSAEMVQGEKQMSYSLPCSTRSPDSRKAGYESVQKLEQKKMKEQQEKDNKNKYGSWGPTFKNREHFVNMHHC